MRAENFYQTSTGNALPLILLTIADYLSDKTNLTSYERNCLNSQQFTGELGDVGILNDSAGKAYKVFVGHGDGQSDELSIAWIANTLPPACYIPQKTLSHTAQVVWSLAQYQFDRYKASENLARILVLGKKESPAVMAEAAAIFLVRDLINTPTNDLGPQELAEQLASLAKEHGAEFKQWVGKELLKSNFPAIHAVGRAASTEPRLLSLTWGNEKHPRVTLVGKGVCFDSGGLDLKGSANMRLMKKDMGGAAQVIGLAQWVMKQAVPIRLQVLIPAVENAVSAEAYHPGDVLTMRNSMTVEVHNTDAEGRLVLADALVKACEDKPELLIDFATLTGAARVAVGTDIAAMFVNDDQLAQELTESASLASDPVWRMPLFAGYEDLFASSIADCANASDSAYAGAITAALFLQRFVPADLPWVHFDIMAWNLVNKPGKPAGGEAMAMRAVGNYLMRKYSS